MAKDRKIKPNQDILEEIQKKERQTASQIKSINPNTIDIANKSSGFEKLNLDLNKQQNRGILSNKIKKFAAETKRNQNVVKPAVNNIQIPLNVLNPY